MNDNALRKSHKDVQKGAGVEGTTYEDYWYDGANRPTSAQNDYSTVTRKYNSYSEVYEETSAVTVNGTTQTKTVNSEYDRLGNRTALVYPSGKRLNYTRDELDRTKNILDEYGKPLAQYAYNGYRIKQRKSGNGTQLDIAYDAMRRMTKMDTTKDGTPFTRIAGFEYGYNDEGMKTFENRLSGTGEISQQAKGNIFTYDSIYQVTGVKYDVLNVTQELNQPGTQTFAKQIGYNFDDSGNRTATTTTQYGQAPVTQNYQVNSLNQYTTIDSGIFAYDNVGNMTQGVIYIDDSANPGSKTPELVNFTYDYTNRLLRVERQNDVAILGEYSYDVFGRRTYKSAWDSTSQSYVETFFWYAGAECIEETDETGQTIATYTFGIKIDEVLNVEYPIASQQYPNYGTYWYHTDALGSVTAVTNSDGAVIERYKYDIYGEATVLAPDGQTVRAESVIGNRILYTGREYDKETGLYYYRARYYHTQIGRFIATDPAGPDKLGNLFAYTNNSAINFSDSYGWGPDDKKRVNLENLYISKYDQEQGKVVSKFNSNKLTDPALQLVFPEEYKEVMQVADNLEKGWMEMSYAEQAIFLPFILTALYFRQDIAESAGNGVTVPLGPCTVTQDDLKYKKDFDIVDAEQGKTKVEFSGEEKFDQGAKEDMTIRSFRMKLTSSIAVNDNKQTVGTSIYYGETNSRQADSASAGVDVNIEPNVPSGIICNTNLLHEENDVNRTDKITLAFGYKYNDYRILFAGKYGFRDTLLGEHSEDTGWKISLQYLLDDSYAKMSGFENIGVTLDYGFEPFEEEPTIGAGLFFDR